MYTFPHLHAAYRAARKGKRDRFAVASFEFDLEHNLFTVANELCTHTYQPGAYNNFHIYEPKKRLISAAPFRDRVIHHALCTIIEPIWESRFIHHTYACRVGKGVHRALDQSQSWVRRYRYAFHGDIVKYFPSIDCQIMRNLLAKRIADPQMMQLIDKIIDNGAGVQAAESPHICFPGDDLFALTRPRGLPIGNLSSQFWANVYLHELDKFVKHELKCPAYLRYMDDFVLFTDDKRQLHRWRETIRQFLANHLRLALHPRKSVIFPTHTGIDF